MIIQAKGDIIKLKGALTENQWPAIRSAVSLLLDEHPRGVVIDASGLTEVSEAGAYTFLDASHFIQAHNARVVVSGLSEDILTAIRKIPGVRSQLVIASTLEEAQASLETGSVGIAKEKHIGPTVLVPLVGAWKSAMPLAVSEALKRHAMIHLLYVLQIPRNLALGVPVPEMEKVAQEVLSEAEQMLKKSGVKLRKLSIRARDVVEGAAKYAIETNPDLVVVGYFKEDLARGGNSCGVVSSFCQDISGDVVFYCAKA